jgi:PelA/Pel-15E family pectate lyase
MKPNHLCRFVLGLSLACSAVISPAEVSWREVNRQPAAWYASDDARAIATSIVQYQRDSGGWTKNRDMRQPPTKEYFESTSREDHFTTIDNTATTTQVAYLARVVTATQDEALRAACLRGMNYLLEAQYDNGGWPQFYPLRKGYYTLITYNDDAMIDTLTILRSVANGEAPYTWVDDAMRARARDAVKRGINCILKTQVTQNGKLTAWCAQHDETTLAPAAARNFEPVSLSGFESVGIVEFLMEIPEPSEAVRSAIEGAIEWFEASAISGLRVEMVREGGEKVRRAIADPSAPRIWARFYELGTNRPIFTGRDKVIRYDYNEIEQERAQGYSYLGHWPETLLTKTYPRWRQQHRLP